MSTTLPNNTESQQDSNVLKQSTSTIKPIVSLVLTATILFGSVLLLRAYIIKPFIVQGVSMYPTFDTWHYLMIDQATYNFYREPTRGEVAVFHTPGNSGHFLIKRIIGLPGETLHISGQVVNITKTDGTTIVLDEPYIIDTKRKDSNISITLADDEYYMLGDNRLESADSRYWGPLKRDKIVGRPIIRLFPLNKIDLMPGEYTYKNN